MSEVGEVVPSKTVTRSGVQVDLARVAESDTLPLHFLRVQALDTVFFSALCELPGADAQLEVVVLEQDGSHETAGVHGQITHANHTTT